MKRTALVLCALTALAVGAQPTPNGQALESQFSAHLGRATSRLSREVKPNEIVHGNVTYSGVAVELYKTGRPLPLLNPAAPPQYGSPEDNVLPDRFDHGTCRWKLFSIRF